MSTKPKASYMKRRKSIILDKFSDKSSNSQNSKNENSPKSEKKIRAKNKKKLNEENNLQKSSNNFPINNIYFPELFINNLEYMERFKCGLCEHICENPRYQYCGCHQIYCQKCLKLYYDLYHNQCPKCQKETKELVPSANFIESLLKLKMKCINYKSKCNWVGIYKEYNEHIKKYCPKEIINCPNKNCVIKVPREEMQLHIPKCEYRDYFCRNCLSKMPFFQKRTHKNFCPKTKILCPQECGEEIEREEVPEHYKECINSNMYCPYKSLGCKDIFQRNKKEERLIHDAPKHLHLAINLILELKEKVNKLEKTIEEMKNKKSNDFNDDNIINRDDDISNDKNDKNSDIIDKDNNNNKEKKFLEKKRIITDDGIQEDIIPRDNSPFSLFNQDLNYIDINNSKHNNNDDLSNNDSNNDYIYEFPKKYKNFFNVDGDIIEARFLDETKHHFIFFNQKYDIPKNSLNKYSFTIKLLTYCEFLAIGICDKKIVERNGYIFDKCSRNKGGLYYFNVKSVVWNCNKVNECFKLNIGPFSAIGTAIICTFDPIKGILEFIIDNSKFITLNEVKCFEANCFSPFLVILKNCKIQTLFNYKR